MNFKRHKTEFAVTPSMFDDATFTEPKQTRFPRSKKARIRRKWAKDPRNYIEVPLTGDRILAILARAAKKMQRKWERQIAAEMEWPILPPTFDPPPEPFVIRVRNYPMPSFVPRGMIFQSCVF